MRNEDEGLLVNSTLSATAQLSLLMCLFFLLIGCSATINKETKINQIETILNAIEGTWNNRTQFEATPTHLKVPPSVSGDWLDLQHATFSRVDAPAIGPYVLYLEWRSVGATVGATGAISRQRIWSFRNDETGAVRMDFFAFVDGAAWVGKGNITNRAAFQGLTTAMLRGYGAACGLRFSPSGTTFRGEINARECNITAASGRKMGIDARVELLTDGTLEYRESGQLEDGRYAFRVPPSQPYRFVRQP
jgi:CpeT/CpcT family (DUF1001)